MAVDTNTDPPVRTFDQTQATSPDVPPGVNNGGLPVFTEDGALSNLKRNPETGDLYDPVTPPTAKTDAGVGNYDDSSDPPSATNTSTDAVPAGAVQEVKPQGNVLDRFFSYTYRASVYLLSPDEWARQANSKKKTVNGYNLLFQSAGAPINSGATRAAGSTDSGRNPFFPQDFYIDSIQLKNLLQGGATQAAHNVATLKFTVVEPLGITLIDRLYQAVQDHNPKGAGGAVNYGNAQYLMVIRFYGYDENGVIQAVGPANAATGLTDANAVVEKFIPFSINKINWEVGSKLVTYEFDCTPIGQQIAAGTRRGTIPYDMQLSGGTVFDALAGSLEYVTAAGNAATAGVSEDEARDMEGSSNPPPPPTAAAARTPKKSIKSGLVGALNEFQKVLVAGGNGQNPIYGVADQYEIVFVGEAEQLIKSAQLVLPGAKTEAKQTPTTPGPTQDVRAAKGVTDSKNTKTRNISIVAGQPIVQVIETIIRNSTFITNQQLTIIDPDTNKEIPNPNLKGSNNVKWFRINFNSIPLGLDKLRNDYAYKVTYYISVYTVSNYDSKYFAPGKFTGVHKSYPWWFTGKNTAVLEYKETLNSAYTMLVSGSDPSNSAAERERRAVAAGMPELRTYAYGARSGESSQGAQNTKQLDPGANLADSLYGGADLGTTTLRIIGDPAWIQQGSMIGGLTSTDLRNPFNADGTINFDAQQIMFEVNWNRPVDYDPATGLADPNSNKNYKTISRVYTAKDVTSDFRQGKFEQTITGLLFNLPKPDGSNKASTAPKTKPASTDRAVATPAEVNNLPFVNTAGGAAVGVSPNLVGSNRPIIPGTLRAKRAENAAAAAANNGAKPVPPLPELTSDPGTGNVTGANGAPIPMTPPQPVTSNGENVSVLDRMLNSLAGTPLPSNPQIISNDDNSYDSPL